MAIGTNTKISYCQFLIDNNTYTFYSDDHNQTISIGSELTEITVFVDLDVDDAYWGGIFNYLNTHVYVNITLPNETVEYNILSFSNHAHLGDRFRIRFVGDSDLVFNQSGEYVINVTYTAYIDGVTQQIEYWNNLTFYAESIPIVTPQEDVFEFYDWLSTGWTGIFGTIGFLGMIIAPALFIWVGRNSDDKFQPMVYFFMAEALFFGFFLVGIG